MRSVILNIAIFSFLLTSFAVEINAQHQHDEGVCGTEPGATMERLIRNKEAIKSGIIRNRNNVTYVPIKYHLSARTNGLGRAELDDILDAHCNLNESFFEQNIQFYIADAEFNEVNNDAVFNDHIRTVNTILTAISDDSALNIFAVNDIESFSGVAGTILGYYDPSFNRDWIVMRNDEFNRSSQTLAHEVGHFFSLPHPHVGWEPAPFVQGEPGWPTAPAISPGGIRTEFADGSNCDTAGDRICDTPADYNGLFNNGCVYNGGALDPQGQEIEPNEALIMSYYSNQCVDQFTNGQKELIEADLSNPDRNRLDIDWTPPAVEVLSEITVAFPPEDDAVPVINGELTVDWYDAPGATHYIFELGENRFFTTSESFMVEGSSIDLSDLSDGEYFYRIRPFNAYNTCATKTTAFSFEIINDQATATREIEFIKNFSVFPNPSDRNGEVFVNVLSDESFDGEVSILDFTGKAIYNSFEKFASGDNQIPVQLNLDASGIYVMFIKSNAGLLQKKFIVN